MIDKEKIPNIHKQDILTGIRNKYKPRYCHDCGEEMIPFDVVFSWFHGRYDKEGYSLYVIVYRCANKRWWHFLKHLNDKALYRGGRK